MMEMSNMHQERIPATASGSNMTSYEETYSNFSFDQLEQQFSWHETGKVNMAYEAIDRHVAEGRGDKVALYYSDSSRDESYTYQELSKQSNRFANVLRGLGI